VPAKSLSLASRSPQRQAILEQLGIEFRVAEPPVPVEERRHGEPRALVIENALRKARAVVERRRTDGGASEEPGERVLGVDTAVVLDGRILGKPSDEQEAETFLRRLSGRTHEVFSGLALCEGGSERTSFAVTRVRFRHLEQRDIDRYLASGEWRERAGAYAIQGQGAALVEEIEGDFWNVVGLPVAELVSLAPDLFAPST
jgi:septum formation protein